MTKPKFEQVFTAFQNYQNAMVRAVNAISRLPDLRTSERSDRLDAECAALKTQLREQFFSFGIEQYIDWD